MSEKAPKRILIAEDEAIIAADVAATVRGLGYEVPAMAATGEEALEIAKRLKPDLILMDILMPGRIDGIEAARTLSKSFDIPVVFLTAHTDESTLERAKGDSLFGYVIKPFSRTDLRVAIELALYKHGMERALRLANARYKAIIAAIPDHIFLLNRSGARVALSSPGHQAADEAFSSEASTLIIDCVERAFIAQGMASVEYDLAVDETMRHFEIRVVPLEGEEFVALVRDMTDFHPAAATVGR